MKWMALQELSAVPDDAAQKLLRGIDFECSECLYDKAKIAVENILMYIIGNELTPREQSVVKMKWFDNKKASYICETLGISQQVARNCMKSAKKKIYACLKYVVLYDAVVGRAEKLPENFHFKIINCIDGKELVS